MRCSGDGKHGRTFCCMLVIVVFMSLLFAWSVYANDGVCCDYVGHDCHQNGMSGIAAGEGHTCFLSSEGNVLCQGNSTMGRNYSGGDALAVAAGIGHTCYLLSSGNVQCMGLDWEGRTANYTGGNALAVAGGYEHTCFLLSNGNVDCQGNNGWGQAKDYLLGDAISVSAGNAHTCFLLSNGNLQCQGYNAYGQAVNYTGGKAISVSGGDYHTCFLLSNGNVQCQGRNVVGEGANYTGGDAVGVACGNHFTCILLSNGNVRCQGDNIYGKAENYTGGDAIGVTGGYDHHCVMLSGGNVQCIGKDWGGQAVNYTGGNATCSIWRPPIQTENDGVLATSLLGYDRTNISEVSGYVWHRNNKGRIDFGNTNLSGIVNLNTAVEAGSRFAYVNSLMYGNLNKSADITLYHIDCTDPLARRIYYSETGDSLDEILSFGRLCGDDCIGVSCAGDVNGNLSFSVSHFTGYAAGVNANLTVYDEIEDGGTMLVYEDAVFYANYTNSGSHISGANCNISFDDAPAVWYVMTEGAANYNYTKVGGFLSNGTHIFNVTCDHVSYSQLDTTDTIEITGLASVPEFSGVGVVIVVLACALGLCVIRGHHDI